MIAAMAVPCAPASRSAVVATALARARTTAKTTKTT